MYKRGSIKERFASKFERGGKDTCWLWRGKPIKSGYGRLNIGGGKKEYAHRLALEFKLGRKIRPGKMATHRCDVKLCVNPRHLREGTGLSNMRECAQRERIHWMKLTASKVKEMRARRREGSTVAELAKRYGVSWNSAKDAVTGRKWSHVV